MIQKSVCYPKHLLFGICVCLVSWLAAPVLAGPRFQEPVADNSPAKQDDDEADEKTDDSKKKSESKPKGIKGTQVGDQIKEITGEDVDGIKFSLSDYRGKVMMIDFWGDW